MKITSYIKGNRKGDSARKVELIALRDPFVGDALEGYYISGHDPVVCLKDISDMEREVVSRSLHKENMIGLMLVPLVFILAALAVAILFLTL